MMVSSYSFPSAKAQAHCSNSNSRPLTGHPYTLPTEPKSRQTTVISKALVTLNLVKKSKENRLANKRDIYMNSYSNIISDIFSQGQVNIRIIYELL